MIERERLQELTEPEIWKILPEFNGRYSVSNYGNIKSNDYVIYHNGLTEKHHTQLIKGKLLKKVKSKDYYRIRLIKPGGKRENFLVHRLVANMFVANPYMKPYVNHIDGNKYNNHYTNLEWVTASENNIHAYKNGLIKISEKRKTASRKNIIKSNKARCKKVYQYDCTLNLINVFNSILDASKELNISKSCISEVCSGKQKMSKGFIFSNKLLIGEQNGH